MFSRQRLLRVAHAVQTQIVIAKFGGQTRLVVSQKYGFCPGDVCPFRKAFSPPAVIFPVGMELRQIERNRDGAGYPFGIKRETLPRIVLRRVQIRGCLLYTSPSPRD